MDEKLKEFRVVLNKVSTSAISYGVYDSLKEIYFEFEKLVEENKKLKIPIVEQTKIITLEKLKNFIEVYLNICNLDDENEIRNYGNELIEVYFEFKDLMENYKKFIVFMKCFYNWIPLSKFEEFLQEESSQNSLKEKIQNILNMETETRAEKLYSLINNENVKNKIQCEKQEEAFNFILTTIKNYKRN